MPEAPLRSSVGSRTGVAGAVCVVLVLVCLTGYAAVVDPMAWLSVVLLAVPALLAVTVLLVLAWLARPAGRPRAATRGAGAACVAASVVLAALGLWSLAVSIDGNDDGAVAVCTVIAVVLCAPLALAVRDVRQRGRAPRC